MHSIFLTTLAVMSVTEASPLIVDVGMVAPQVMVVTLHEGAVELGELVPYTHSNLK